MKPICRFLISSAILAVALAPLILLVDAPVEARWPHGGWVFSLFGLAEWYRLVENRRRTWVERITPEARKQRGAL